MTNEDGCQATHSDVAIPVPADLTRHLMDFIPLLRDAGFESPDAIRAVIQDAIEQTDEGEHSERLPTATGPATPIRSDTGPTPGPKTMEKLPESSIGAAAPCCCKLRLTLDKVTVEDNTGSFVSDAVNDKVAILWAGLNGKVDGWPHNPKGIEIPEGKSQEPKAFITEIAPTLPGCKFNVIVGPILIYQLPDNILDEIAEIIRQIAELLRQAAVAAGLAAAIIALPPVSGAFASQIANLVSKLPQPITGLAELLQKIYDLTTRAELMAELNIPLSGELPCVRAESISDGKTFTGKSEGASTWSDAMPVRGQNAFLIETRIENHGGTWLVRFKVEAVCP